MKQAVVKGQRGLSGGVGVQGKVKEDGRAHVGAQA